MKLEVFVQIREHSQLEVLQGAGRRGCRAAVSVGLGVSGFWKP